MKKLTKLNRAALIAATLFVTAGASKSNAQIFNANDILVSASTYEGNASTITPGVTVLPGSGSTAVADGSYPNFTQNDNADSNFGITSPLSLLELNPTTGILDNTVNVTGVTGVVTSFTSKSEGSLNLSQDGTAVTIMGYDSTINQLDISNSNTPGDPNGATTSAPNTYRAIAQINADGTGSQTDINLYSGDNPRAAILTSNGYYTVGNSGDKSSTALANVGAQLVTPGGDPNTNATLLGSFNTTQVGNTADTESKDNNFRGETIFNNTLYVTKGSGSNGIDTVYQVGSTGSLPTGTSNAINVLPGFNTLPAKSDGKNTSAANFGHPFGLFFANATTLYVGDEGSGKASDITALQSNPTSTLVDGQQFAGLDKYSLVSGSWKLDYVLSLGLNIGQSYTVSGTTPGGDTGSYTVTSTDGLRDITGKVNADGTVTIYGITSTVSGNTDQGADPNKVVAISDVLGDTSASQVTGEEFDTINTAAYGQVLRGVSFTPQAAPEPSSWALAGICLGMFAWLRNRVRRTQS